MAKKRPVVELAMIVRDGGAGLERAIRSAWPAVDRVIVGDTGSKDDSVARARGLGAEVLNVPWEENFAKARNTILSSCRGDWVLLLDADEMLDPDGARMIPTLVRSGQVDAWEVWKWHYIRSHSSRSGVEASSPNPGLLPEAREYPAYTRSLGTLLFRRLPELYFEYEVHETVSRRVRALQLRVGAAPFVVHHFGLVEDSEEQRIKKLERYHQLEIRKVNAHPDDCWAHYELGLSELEHRQNPEAALMSFYRAVQIDEQFKPGWLYLGICLVRLEKFELALEILEKAGEPGRPNAVLEEARGDANLYCGKVGQAAECYQRASQLAHSSPLIECKLGACEVRLGCLAEGMARIEAGIARDPHNASLGLIREAAAQYRDVAAEQRAVVNSPRVLQWKN